MVPTDEQREQFEANFLACSPMSLPSDFTRDSVGGYENDYLQQRWHGWVEGQRARDAEVQALRKALAEIVDCHVAIEEHRENGHVSRDAVDAWWGAARIARAALRTEEGTDDE